MKKVILIYGLPGSGKTTLAAAIHDLTRSTSIWFNADKVRSTLSSDLGFSEESRIEQARRMGCLASLALDGSELNLAIVDFVNPTLPTSDTFFKNLHRPKGNKLDDSKRLPEPFMNGVHFEVFSVLMDTIHPDDSRFKDTRNLFEGLADGRKPNFHVNAYLDTPEAFAGLASAILKHIGMDTALSGRDSSSPEEVLSKYGVLYSEAQRAAKA